MVVHRTNAPSLQSIHHATSPEALTSLHPPPIFVCNNVSVCVCMFVYDGVSADISGPHPQHRNISILQPNSLPIAQSLSERPRPLINAFRARGRNFHIAITAAFISPEENLSRVAMDTGTCEHQQQRAIKLPGIATPCSFQASTTHRTERGERMLCCVTDRHIPRISRKVLVPPTPSAAASAAAAAV